MRFLSGSILLGLLPLFSWTAAAGETAKAPPPDNATMEAIGGYRVLTNPFTKRNSNGKRISEIFNPFQTRKPRRLHGAVYLFHRNDNFDARNFFDPLDQPLPEFKRNQFGFQVGGRATTTVDFLVRYDGLRLVQGQTLLSHVPSRSMQEGDFSALETVLVDPWTGKPFPGNVIPPDRIHPVARKLLSVIPQPNQSDPDRNFVNNQPFISDQNAYTFQVDKKLSSAARVVGRYEYRDENESFPRSLPAFGANGVETDHDLRLSFQRHFTSRFSFELRLNLRRNVDLFLSRNSGRDGLLSSLGIAGVSRLDSSDEGYPDIRLSGYASFGDNSSPSRWTRNSLEFDTVFGYDSGDHNLRFGSDIRATQLNDIRSGGDRRGEFSFNGAYTGDAFADFLLGIPETAQRGLGSDRNDLRRNRWKVFVSDRWKINPYLSLSAGLTYNYFEPHRSLNPISIVTPLLVESQPDSEFVIAGSDRAAELGFPHQDRFQIPDFNDWEPSLGLAISPTGTNRLVVRANYDWDFNSLSDGLAVRYIGRNYPFFFLELAQSPQEAPEIDLADPFQGAAPPEIRARGIEPGSRTANHQSWSLVMQSQIQQHWKVEATYRGQKGSNLSRLAYGNVPPPGQGPIPERRPDPELGRFSILSGGGSSTGHTMALDLERQLVGGISLRSGFRWAKHLSDVLFSGAANPRDLAAEKAVPNWLRLHTGFINYIFDLPLETEGRWLNAVVSGWRVSGISRFQDGRPFTVVLPGDFNNDGVSSDRPDRLSSGSLDPGQRSIDAWFDTNAFAEPSAEGFGNSGRNILIGPGFHNWDIGLSRISRVADGHNVEFRIEFFNAFNHPNFGLPDREFGTSVFGKTFSASRAREIELALKYTF